MKVVHQLHFKLLTAIPQQGHHDDGESQSDEDDVDDLPDGQLHVPPHIVGELGNLVLGAGKAGPQTLGEVAEERLGQAVVSCIPWGRGGLEVVSCIPWGGGGGVRVVSCIPWGGGGLEVVSCIPWGGGGLEVVSCIPWGGGG